MDGQSTFLTRENAETLLSTFFSGNSTETMSFDMLTKTTEMLPELPEDAEAIFTILRNAAEQSGINMSEISLENAAEFYQTLQGAMTGVSLDDLMAIPENTLYWLKNGGLKLIAQNVTFLQMALSAYSMYRNIKAGNKQDAAFDAGGIAARMTGFDFTSLGGIGFLTEVSKGITTLARGEYVLGLKHLGESVNKLAAFILPTLSIYGGTTIATWLASPSALLISIPAIGYIAYKGWQYAKSYALRTWQQKALETLEKNGYKPDELMNALSLCIDPNFLLKVLSNKEVQAQVALLWMAQRDSLLARSSHFARPIQAIGRMIAFVKNADNLAEKLHEHARKWLSETGHLQTLETAVGKDNVEKYGLQLIQQLHELAKLTPAAVKTFLDADLKRKEMLSGTFRFALEMQNNPLFKAAIDKLLPDWERLKKEIYEPLRQDLQRELSGDRQSATLNPPSSSPAVLFSGGPGSVPAMIGSSSFIQSGCSMKSWNWMNPLSMMPGLRRCKQVLC